MALPLAVQPVPAPPNPLTTGGAVTTSVPPVTVTLPAPRAPAAVAFTTPAETVTPPVRPALLPVRVRVPGPVLVTPWVLASGADTVAVMAALLTATDGPAALLRVRVLVPPTV